MANDKDLELFLKGVKAWNEGVEKWEVEPHEQSWRFKTDLSGADIGGRMWRRVLLEDDFYMEQATHYPRAPTYPVSDSHFGVRLQRSELYAFKSSGGRPYARRLEGGWLSRRRP